MKKGIKKAEKKRKKAARAVKAGVKSTSKRAASRMAGGVRRSDGANAAKGTDLRARQAPRVRTETRGVGEDLELLPVSRRSPANRAGQSGDLQGLSDAEGANAESVDELLEEGNAYEAEIVSGVENALVPEKGPVRTREVEEDDVPEEYLEQDPFDRQ
jgi:hypothetical protein